MNSVPWPLVKEAFSRILDASDVQRESILQECSATPGLKTEVLSLLASHQSASQSLTNTSRASDEAAAATLPEFASGFCIGKYRVVRLIDSGGMGSVFEALDTQLNRSVALKVLHSPLPSPSLRRRFDDESRILARLRHGSIAQIYEAGTYRSDLTGAATPFFAMELVPDASSIDQWVRHSRPARAALLSMFVTLCDAIQHGHQRGIVHRDIKPANILIDSAGALKVIDFGVAQALEDTQTQSRRTGMGQLIGTLQYMSPEACSGDPLDIDVRSDVYSLGVVLYELLCGAAAHRLDTASLLEAVRTIREDAPRPISAHDPSLRGDLESIVHMALRKEREHRYQSVADLSADIQRYLRLEPVHARPPAPLHQFRLFARRNKLAVSAFALVCIALIVGITGLSLGLSRARRATAEALVQSQRATRTSEFLINTLRSTNPLQPAIPEKTIWDAEVNPVPSPGAWGYAGRPSETLTARDLISFAADKVQDQFKDDPVLRADVLTLLAGSLRETGLDPRTELFTREALELCDAALGPLDRKTIAAHLNCSQEAWLKSDHEALLRHRRIAMESSLAAFGPLDALTRACTASYAGALSQLDPQSKPAQDLLREQNQRVAAAFGADSYSALVEQVRLGYILPDAAEAIPLLLKVQKVLESRGQSGTLLWCDTSLQIAHVYSRSCDTQPQAAMLFLEVRDAFDHLLYPHNPRSTDIEGALLNCYMRMGRVDLAVPLSRTVADAAVNRFQPGTIGNYIDKGRHARILAEAGLDLENAASLARQSVEGIDKTDPINSADWAIFYTAVRAQALRKLGRASEAIAVLEQRTAIEPQRINPAWAYGFLYNECAESYALQGRTADAIASAQLAVRTAGQFDSQLDQCHPILKAIRATAARLNVSFPAR